MSTFVLSKVYVLYDIVVSGFDRYMAHLYTMGGGGGGGPAERDQSQVHHIQYDTTL